jgi:hypothetical protein
MPINSYKLKLYRFHIIFKMIFANFVKMFIILHILFVNDLTLSENVSAFSKYSNQLKSEELNSLKAVLEWFNRNEVKLAFMDRVSLKHEYDRFIVFSSSLQQISKQLSEKIFFLLEKYQKEKMNSAIKKLSEKEIVKKVMNSMINKNPSRFGK